MPWYDFRWNDILEAYLAEHGVSTEDYEVVVSNPESVDFSRSRPDRLIAWGYTEDGRLSHACMSYSTIGLRFFR